MKNLSDMAETTHPGCLIAQCVRNYCNKESLSKTKDWLHIDAGRKPHNATLFFTSFVFQPSKSKHLLHTLYSLSKRKQAESNQFGLWAGENKRGSSQRAAPALTTAECKHKTRRVSGSSSELLKVIRLSERQEDRRRALLAWSDKRSVRCLPLYHFTVNDFAWICAMTHDMLWLICSAAKCL